MRVFRIVCFSFIFRRSSPNERKKVSVANKKRWVLFFIFMLLVINGLVLAITSQETKKEENEDKRWGVIILPALFYMPETKWGGGAGGLITYRPPRSQTAGRPSSLNFYAIYTQLKQFSTQMNPELYFKDEGYLLTATIIAETFPDKFWGIGNETEDEAEEKYTPRSFNLEFSLQKRIWSKQNLYAGLFGLFENYQIIKYETGKSLAKEIYSGSRGGTTSGLGIILNWDRRDNIFFPRRGHYYQLVIRTSRKFLGSDFETTVFKFDLRKFIPLFSDQVLAWQILFESINGTPSFKNYAKLGGNSIMRGYYSGRYRDKCLLALQGEYRLPLWRRWGMVAFAGIGDVSKGLGNFNFKGFKYSFGFGLRFKIAPKEGTNLRLDFAWGKGTSGFYFTAGEAF